MTEPSHEPSRMGCLFAAALIFAPGIGLSLWKGEVEWGFALFYGVLLAIPYAYLALEGTRAPLPWAVVFGLTMLFWGSVICEAVISLRDRSGVSGLALLLLLFPFVATYAAWHAVKFSKR